MMIFVSEREWVADPPRVEILRPPLVIEEDEIPDKKWGEAAHQEQDGADQPCQLGPNSTEQAPPQQRPRHRVAEKVEAHSAHPFRAVNQSALVGVARKYLHPPPGRRQRQDNHYRSPRHPARRAAEKEKRPRSPYGRFRAHAQHAPPRLIAL